MLSNSFLRSSNLSLASVGLLGRVMGLPDDWDYSVAGLVFICKEGKTAIDSALKELKNIGYLVVTKLYANMTASKLPVLHSHRTGNTDRKREKGRHTDDRTYLSPDTKSKGR